MSLRHTSALLVLLAALVSMAATGVETSVAAEVYTKWMSGSGDWTNADRWSDGLPDPYKNIEIHGSGTVRVPPGAYPISNLQIGKNCGDHTRVEVDGGKLVLLQNPLDLGDVSGSEAELILKDGALHNCVDTYVGGGMGVAGRRGVRSSFRAAITSDARSSSAPAGAPNHFSGSKDHKPRRSTCCNTSTSPRMSDQTAHRGWRPFRLRLTNTV